MCFGHVGLVNCIQNVSNYHLGNIYIYKCAISCKLLALHIMRYTWIVHHIQILEGNRGCTPGYHSALCYIPAVWDADGLTSEAQIE